MRRGLRDQKRKRAEPGRASAVNPRAFGVRPGRRIKSTPRWQILCNSQASSTGNNASWPILTALLGRVRFPHVSGARIGPPSLSGLRWRRDCTYSHRGSSLPCPLAVNDMFWLRWRALEEYQCGVALAPLSVSAVFRLWGRASVRLLLHPFGVQEERDLKGQTPVVVIISGSMELGTVSPVSAKENGRHIPLNRASGGS